MKRSRVFAFTALFAVFALFFLSGAALSGDTVTIVGTVNDYYQIVTDDGEIFDVAEGEKGDELIDLVNQRLKVTGEVDEHDGGKYITVTSYEILGD